VFTTAGLTLLVSRCLGIEPLFHTLSERTTLCLDGGEFFDDDILSLIITVKKFVRPKPCCGNFFSRDALKIFKNGGYIFKNGAYISESDGTLFFVPVFK